MTSRVDQSLGCVAEEGNWNVSLNIWNKRFEAVDQSGGNHGGIGVTKTVDVPSKWNTAEPEEGWLVECISGHSDGVRIYWVSEWVQAESRGIM